MKRILLFFITTLLATSAFSQGIRWSENKSYTKTNGILPDSISYVARSKAARSPVIPFPLGDSGRLAYEGKHFWGYSDTGWVRFLTGMLAINDVSGLQDSLNLKANSSVTLTAGTGLTGGGNLTANRSFAVNFGTAAGTVAQGNDSRINNGQTAFGWGNHASAGYELQSNKSTSTALGTSNTLYPTQNAVKTYVDAAAGGVSRTLQQVTDAGHTSTNSIALTNAATYSTSRIVSSKTYTGTFAVGLVPGTDAATGMYIDDGTTSKFIAVRHADNAPTYSPNNGTNRYTIWHENNHPAGSAFTPTLTGANVPASFTTNSAGHVTGFTTRVLTAGDIEAAPVSGSANYIQNGTSQQTANFNISGAGTLGGTLTAPVLQSPSGENLTILANGAPTDAQINVTVDGLGIGGMPGGIHTARLYVDGNTVSDDAYVLDGPSGEIGEFFIGSGGIGVRTTTAHPLTLYSNNQERMTIRADGVIHTTAGISSHARIVNTAIAFTVNPNDYVIIMEGMGTSAGDGVLITLPDPSTNGGRLLEFHEYSASNWATNYDIYRPVEMPLTTIGGVMVIRAVNGKWRLVSKF